MLQKRAKQLYWGGGGGGGGGALYASRECLSGGVYEAQRPLPKYDPPPGLIV